MATVPTATTKSWFQTLGRWALSAPIMALAAIVCAHSVQAQELIYKEDFNTDGNGTRYSVEGQGVVNKNGQVVPVPGGPSYWARNVDVIAKGEVVGVPFPAPARRAVMLFNHGLDPAFLTDDGKKLIDATIKWLTDGKQKMVVMFSAPAGAESLGDQYLVSTLTAQGHTVIDDDVATYPVLADIITAQKVDFIINSSTGGDPIRLATASVPLLSFAGDLIGDMLLATRGLTDTTFDPGDVKIEAPTHPIAAGLPATFKFVTEAQPFDTIGLGLPPGSVTVASYQFTDDAGVVSTRPFLVATEKGVQLLGGLISGMEGSGYWAGADLNEPNISTPPDDPARTGQIATDSNLGPRSLTLNPVDVTGKPKLKLTFAMAGTEVDFDGPGGDDYFSIKVDLKNTGEFIELARYGSPTATDKFLVEMIKGGDGMGGPPDLIIPDYTKRIGIVARDLTYDIPDGATKLVVRFEALCTFWNEIMAFDNIRITSGDIVTPQIPLPAAANLKLWLSADKGVTATAGSVSAWDDQSGNLNNAAQSDTTAQPQLVANAVNKKPVIRFDGNNDYLIVPNSPSVAIAGDITTFFVVKFDDFASFRAVWAKTTNNLPGANDWYALPTTGIPRAYRGNGTLTSIGFADGTTPLAAGAYLIVGWDMAGTTLHHYLNGETNGAGQITAALADAGKPLLIGTRDDFVTKMKGDIAEIIIYDTALSDADRGKVVDYLANKYAIGAVSAAPKISIARSGNDAVITFTGALEAADVVTGPWSEVTGATSPRTVPLSSAAARFYRSRL